MIGIETIDFTLGSKLLANAARGQRLGASTELLDEKIGVRNVARLEFGEDTSDIAATAVKRLFARGAVTPEEIGCLIVVTQNPDGFGLPQVASILQHKLGLPTTCAAFDISLGCSGFVYGLSVATAFMGANGIKRGLLVTADPYSKILDEEDRNTALLFGDAAAAILLSERPTWVAGGFDFGTRGADADSLRVDSRRKLNMNGRTVFNFSAQEVPRSILKTLAANDISPESVDLIVLHQGSRFIVETIARRLGMEGRVPFFAADYGNTVSSSIPIGLAQLLTPEMRHVVISGFGVGLSWATTVLNRV